MSNQVPSGYVFDRGDADHARLRRVAALQAEVAREACLRAGLAPGDRAIDVGCGPLGALPVLAELVGPAGAVVGLDSSAGALEQARRACADRGLAHVTLVQDDVNTLDPATLLPSGPFDLAFCRLFLVHQADPAATLGTIAALVRPGGRVVAQDVLHDPNFPTSEPSVPAVRRVFELLIAGIGAKGGSPDVARHYAEVCAAAGVRLVSQRGTFALFDDPGDLPDGMRAMLASIRGSAVASGLVTEEELDGLDRELAAAGGTSLRFATSSLSVVLTAEVP